MHVRDIRFEVLADVDPEEIRQRIADLLLPGSFTIGHERHYEGFAYSEFTETSKSPELPIEVLTINGIHKYVKAAGLFRPVASRMWNQLGVEISLQQPDKSDKDPILTSLVDWRKDPKDLRYNELLIPVPNLKDVAGHMDNRPAVSKRALGILIAIADTYASYRNKVASQ